MSAEQRDKSIQVKFCEGMSGIRQHGKMTIWQQLVQTERYLERKQRIAVAGREERGVRDLTKRLSSGGSAGQCFQIADNALIKVRPTACTVRCIKRLNALGRVSADGFWREAEPHLAHHPARPVEVGCVGYNTSYPAAVAECSNESDAAAH